MTVVDFCFDFFSTIWIFLIFPKKVIGPDDSEKVLGRPRGSGRASWASGGVQEASWGVLGGSGGRLGSVLGALGATLERPSRQSDFGSFF